jgi:hypothetical protein
MTENAAVTVYDVCDSIMHTQSAHFCEVVLMCKPSMLRGELCQNAHK